MKIRMANPEENTILDNMTHQENIAIHMDMKIFNNGSTKNYNTREKPDCFDISQDDHNGKNMVDTIFSYHSEDCSHTITKELNSQNFAKVSKSDLDISNYHVIDCDNIENKDSNVQNGYGLRTRKNLSVNDELFYAFNDSDAMKCSKVLQNAEKSFRGLQCSGVFSDNSGLNNHRNNQISCSSCNSVFCTEDLFQSHVVVCKKQFNEEVDLLKCQKCHRLLNSKSEFQYHVCSNSKIYKCEKCNRIFNDENELEHHILDKQCRNLDGFTCDTCKHTFTDFYVLKKHIADHLGNSSQCTNCSEWFDSEILLAHHKCKIDVEAGCDDTIYTNHNYDNVVFEDSQLKHKCLKCNVMFSSQGILNEHRCIETVQKYENCEKDFRDNLQYKSHSVSDKSCKNCKEEFTDELKFSELVHVCKMGDLSSEKLKYECDVCGKKYSRLTKLQFHILNVHHGVTYSCQKCNLKFQNPEEHDDHLAKGCKAEELCSCKTCGKLFSRKDYLKKHEYIHSNIFYRCKYCHCAFMKEKSYKKHTTKMNCSKSARKIKLSEFNYKKCRICNDDFEEEELLIQHFNDIHPGENPHQCFCCDSCLPTFSELQNHIHLHNVQKYTCSICGKAYTSQEGFRKHRLKHKGAEFKCQFCESEFLNERRFQFHVKTCKKNPNSAYHQNDDKTKTNKKEEKRKQSRQLHWESRIIMKRLRGDPNSANKYPEQQDNPDNASNTNFFDEPDADSNDSNVRGWFDDYYKTEEDDVAFGLKKGKQYEFESRNTGPALKEKSLPPTTFESIQSMDENDAVDSHSESSSSESSDNSSEEEDFDEDVELPFDYNPKKCRICLITFSQEYELLHHFIKLHPDKKAHKCPHCDAESPLFAQLKEHMKTHGIGMGIYYCDNCSKKFKSEKKMKSHNIRCKGLNVEAALSDGTDKGNTQFKLDNEDYCKRCCKKFQTKCGYRRHKRVCKERRRNCKENKRSQGFVVKDVHSRDQTPSPPAEDFHEESIPPPQLESSSQEPEENKTKTAFVSEPPLDSFPCRLCEKKFQYERGIVMHFKADHPGHKPLVCHICNTHLADKLKEHLKTHGIGEEFVCELCGKRFNQKFLSKIHEMWHQGVEYKCNNCKQKFLNKEKMDKHINENRCSNRQSLMRLPCDICGKSYRSKFGLSKHYITHTPKELRPIKNRMNCEFCGKWFDTNNGLQRHRRIHTGERPFCCRFCSKSFVQEGNCKSHERIHTGEQRPRKKRSGASEPVPYPADLNACLFNGLNTNKN